MKSHGGSLLFKLVANKTSTTKETNYRAIITIVKIQIETSCKGEVISDLMDLFRSIGNIIVAIYEYSFP